MNGTKSFQYLAFLPLVYYNYISPLSSIIHLHLPFQLMCRRRRRSIIANPMSICVMKFHFRWTFLYSHAQRTSYLFPLCLSAAQAQPPFVITSSIYKRIRILLRKSIITQSGYIVAHLLHDTVSRHQHTTHTQQSLSPYAPHTHHQIPPAML